MSVTNACPECGARVPADAPLGLCPRCLMNPSSSETATYFPTGKPEAAAKRPPAIGWTEVVRVVRELELVAAEELDRLASAAAGDPVRLARALVQAKTLTAYQAGALLQGKARGLVIGSYLVEDRLGAGGMGVVLKARHRPSGRVVALKLLPPSFGGRPEAVRRFHREFQIASRLSHPNLIAAIEANEDRGVHYLTMEYISGYDLDTLVSRGGPMAIKLALHCTIQAARGLEAAHAQGVIHRDIKPSNIMIDPTGTVRVLDLGLARVIEHSNQFGRSAAGSLTQTGVYMGTVDFLAPEQANDAKSADARSDIYSLGCTLYHLLTGSSPFLGDTILKRLLAHQEHPAPSLRAARPEVPERLDDIYMRMMAKRPADRPQSMSEVIMALEACRTSAREAGDASAELKTFARTIMKRAPARGWRGPDTSIFARSKRVEPTFDPDLRLEDLITDYREEGGHDPIPEDKLPPIASHRRPKRLRRRRRSAPVDLVALAASLAALAMLGIVIYLKSDRREARTAPGEATPKVAAGAVPGSQKPAVAAVPSPLLSKTALETGEGSAAGEMRDDNALKLKLHWCPQGSFRMGSPPTEPDRENNEGPVNVTLTRGFWLGKYEVTQEQWRQVMGTTLRQQQQNATDTKDIFKQIKGEGPDFPMYLVNHPEAEEFCRRFTASEQRAGRLPSGWEYRLPTEAQWEYACRAGSTTATAFGDRLSSADANFIGTEPYNGAAAGPSPYTTTAVGGYRPNAWGLYDMHGNVWEWCRDGYVESLPGGVDPFQAPAVGVLSRVIRGGSWDFNGAHCRSASRRGNFPAIRYLNLGFRVARVPSEAEAVKPASAPSKATEPTQSPHVGLGTGKSVESRDDSASDPLARLSPRTERGASKPGSVPASIGLPAAPRPLVAPFDATAARAGQAAWARYLNTTVERKNPIGMTLVLIPPGEFLMGSTPEQFAVVLKMVADAKFNPDEYASLHRPTETPQHRVRLTKPYRLGMTEVTVGQFQKFVQATRYVTEAEQLGFGNSTATMPDATVTPEMKKMTWRTPGHAATEDFPVTQVSWNDAAVFCNWLSAQENLMPCYRQGGESGWVLLASGRGYRLPTEAEWEYACRAGTATLFSFGDDPGLLDAYAWIRVNSEFRPRPVALKRPNAFGLFDVHGGAWEHCVDYRGVADYGASPGLDPFGPSRPAWGGPVRGGSWVYDPPFARSAHRGGLPPGSRRDDLGFRVVRVQSER